MSGQKHEMSDIFLCFIFTLLCKGKGKKNSPCALSKDTHIYFLVDIFKARKEESPLSIASELVDGPLKENKRPRL